MKVKGISLAVRKLHPETRANEFIWDPDCECELCTDDLTVSMPKLATTLILALLRLENGSGQARLS